jgi:hypothetical protein
MNSDALLFQSSRRRSLPAAVLGATTLLAALQWVSPIAAEEKPAVAPAYTPEAEAAYTRTIEKRAADVLAALKLSEGEKSTRVHDILIAHYRALRDWHDTNGPKLKGATGDAARELKTSLKVIHDKFLASLAGQLTPSQVEIVKDKMTYNKVKVTYDAYCEIVPGLTEPQKQRMLELLKEAREEAMDAGSSNEKDEIFRKYKGKINNYLSAEGHDVGKAYKDWGAKQKNKTAPQSAKPQSNA